jgi:hypothetical protein
MLLGRNPANAEQADDKKTKYVQKPFAHRFNLM